MIELLSLCKQWLYWRYRLATVNLRNRVTQTKLAMMDIDEGIPTPSEEERALAKEIDVLDPEIRRQQALLQQAQIGMMSGLLGGLQRQANNAYGMQQRPPIPFNMYQALQQGAAIQQTQAPRLCGFCKVPPGSCPFGQCMLNG